MKQILRVPKFQFSTAIFAGQGSAKQGMGQQHLENPKFKNLITQFNEVLNYDIKDIMINDTDNKLNNTVYQQPAIFVNQYLSYLHNQEINKQNIELVIGNSVGEYTALTIAGILDPIQTIKLLQKRGELMQSVFSREVGGNFGMLAVKSENQEAFLMKVLNQIDNNKTTCKQHLQIDLALYNSNKQVVFSGHREILEEFKKQIKQQHNISSIFLKVNAAFHSKILSSIKNQFEETLRITKINVPEKQKIKVIRNVDTSQYKFPEEVIQGLIKQIDQPVMFYQSVCKSMQLELQDDFIEYGAEKPIVSKFIQDAADQFGETVTIKNFY